MDGLITTKTIGSGISKVDEDFILSEQPMSRLVFRALIHQAGIKGRIIRQRREFNNDEWISEEAIDIRTLGKKEFINIEIDTEATKNLYLAITKLAEILKSHGIEYGEHKYTVVDPDSIIITDENISDYVKKLVDSGYNEEIWKKLVEENPTLITKLSIARLQQEKGFVVDELQNRLAENSYSETTGDDSWQKWIFKNNWLFGVNYLSPIEKTKINIIGVMPDYIFPTVDGFVDLLEIKLPGDKVILEDTSHTGAWRWTVETNKAIGQVVNYLSEIDRLRFEIERNVLSIYGLSICFLKPRAFILIGNSSEWNERKLEALRKMNHSLHGLEILTYNELIDRGKQSNI